MDFVLSCEGFWINLNLTNPFQVSTLNVPDLNGEKHLEIFDVLSRNMLRMLKLYETNHLPEMTEPYKLQKEKTPKKFKYMAEANC